MKRIIPFFFIIFFAAGVFAQVGTLTVTVLSSQEGTGLTEIDYEFTGDDDVYNITVEVSFDNEGSYTTIPDSDLDGALTNVASGGPYKLIWDGMKTFQDIYSEQTIIKIGATSTTFTCGDDLTFTYRGQEVTYGTVSKTYTVSPPPQATLCWFDRNLGASQVATSSTDADAYGDLFQWGRLDDGHQDRQSGTTSTLSNTDVPGHGNFITNGSSPYDWRNPQNDNLWQGEESINNPCPPGWRVPTVAELNAERQSWGSNNSAGAYASTLQWPVGGYRFYDGTLGLVGSYGYVWSSSVSGTNASFLYFYSGSALMLSGSRAFGMSVRCVRDE